MTEGLERQSKDLPQGKNTHNYISNKPWERWISKRLFLGLKICIILGRFLTDIIVRRSNQYRHAIEPNKKSPRYEDSRSHEWQKGKGLEVNCESLPIKLTYETIP